MRLWRRIDWEGAQRRVASEEFCYGLGCHKLLAVCGILIAGTLLFPKSLFAMPLEREFIQEVAIKSVSIEPQIVKTSQYEKVDHANDPTLFDVYLDEDRPLVKEDVSEAFEESVGLMQVDPTGALIIEAYCDRRGSGSYSLALGHRRSSQIKEFVQNLGVSESQIHSVSYGNENPQCRDTSRRCWEENVRIQSTFRYIAIKEPKLGCLGRLRLQGKKQQFSSKSPRQFLQKIRLAPSKSKKSLAIPPASHRQ